MQNKLLILISVIGVAALLLWMYLPRFYADSMTPNKDEYVYPQVNVSFRSSSISPESIGMAIEEAIAKDGFTVKSSTLTNQKAEGWSKSGMLEILWRRDGDYVSVDNLLSNDCYKVRVYSAESEVVATQIIEAIKSSVGRLEGGIVWNTSLDCT